jgi:Flp pilus assembly pilin Flp
MALDMHLELLDEQSGRPVMRSFLTRFCQDQRGAHVVEMSIAVGLFALIAAFGFFAMGDAIADYYVTLKCNFHLGSLFVETNADVLANCP